MKRVVEKVRDIVEICPFTHLHDFAADPGLTLAGYHFTDITADLMSKWIDRVAGVRPGQGGAFALAGFRGVGKSHFLSALAAIVARPELRSRISDQHVASSAERLSRRHGSIAFVRRGSGASLLDELKSAVGLVVGAAPETLNDSLHELLQRAADQAGEVPLLLLIDTASGRDTRVARDDGVRLSEIAEVAKGLGIFVGVALDDDISGADGANASIAANFNIDYLDQEHLYKIVDSVIFSKHNQMRSVLHDIYEDYRAELPGFRWSEQRFTSLYPLHPATVEIAPLIRLYIHDFALLGFAAEAGVKILGRPANSLIGIDEVFDSVENKLRLVPQLADAFAAFERIERDVISKTPVHFRHPAKLILKGLLILSLNGEGASAPEIAASMMIFGGDSADGQGLNVATLLDSFVEGVAGSVDRMARDGAPAKYCFRLSTKLDVDGLLADAVKEVPESVVWKVLLAQTAEKYSELDPTAGVTSYNLEWRGGFRRGELLWPPVEGVQPPEQKKGHPDWVIRVEPDAADATYSAENSTIAWRLAKLTPDEKDAIRRYHALHNDSRVREQFGAGLSTAMHVHSIAVEKIWQRVFLQDSYLTAGGITYKFTEDARSAHGLSQLLTVMLAPVFEGQFPAHPQFGESLGHKQAAELISNFFGGSGATNADTQKLAESFALPLGLATKQGELIVPTPAESLLDLDIVKAGFAGASAETAIDLRDVSIGLQAPPVGLTREAQHLVLAALVAQKEFEFVTSSGNRINHRSLDLQIIWDDIVGVAKPLNEVYSVDRLLIWAKIITGNSGLKSLDKSEDRLLIIDSLAGWLTGWKQSCAIDEFDALPDENLNAGIWRTAANLRKSFGAMADIIDLLTKNEQSLDESLQNIADLFSDSENEYESKKSDLRVLSDFTAGVSRRTAIESYLSLCEDTENEEIEAARFALLDTIKSGKFAAAGVGKEKLEAVWADFKQHYSNYYAEKHDLVMKSGASGEKLRAVLSSDEWSAFESFSSVLWLDGLYFSTAKNIVRELRQLHCESKVSDSLISKPICGCSFSLADSGRLAGLPAQLSTTIGRGIASYRAKFLENQDQLATAADSDAMNTSIRTILGGLGSGDELGKLDEPGYPNIENRRRADFRESRNGRAGDRGRRRHADLGTRSKKGRRLRQHLRKSRVESRESNVLSPRSKDQRPKTKDQRRPKTTKDQRPKPKRPKDQSQFYGRLG